MSQNQRRARLVELALLGAATLLFFSLAKTFDVYERFYDFSRAHDEWGLDEIVITLAALAILLGSFAWRRRRELEAEIVQRQVAEAALKANEQRFRALVENSADAITLIDRTGVVIYDSPAAPGMLGYTPDERVGRDAFELIHPDDVASNQALFAQLLAQPATRVRTTFRLRHGDGSWRWIEADTTNLLAEPAVGAIVVNYRDVTQRRQAKAAVAASERRFRGLIENAPDGIALVNAAGRFDYVSPSTERILGYRSDDILGYTPLELTHRGDRLAMLRLLRFVSGQPGQTAATQYRFRHLDGRWVWLESTLSNLLEEPGVNAVVFNYRDISERKRADVQIQRQLERLAALRAIDLAITSSFDLGLILSAVLAHVTDRLGVDAAAVLVYDQDLQVLVERAHRGFRSTFSPRTQLRLGEGYAGQAAQECQIVHIPDVAARDDNPRFAEIMAADAFTNYYALPLLANGQLRGVLEVFQRVPQLVVDDEWLGFLNTLAGQAAIAIDNVSLFDGLQRSSAELAQAYDATIVGWSHALDLRDEETEGHSQRVTELTLQLAQAMNVSEIGLEHLRRGALLHDIGKMGVPDRILLKPGPLTDDEWIIMRQHPIFAHDLLAPIAYLRPALDIPYCHHEKWDGTGYPRGLKGETIPLAARLFAVVDVWDALCSDRPYRPAWPQERVLEHIRSLSGSHFDPRAVEAFLQLIHSPG